MLDRITELHAHLVTVLESPKVQDQIARRDAALKAEQDAQQKRAREQYERDMAQRVRSLIRGMQDSAEKHWRLALRDQKSVEAASTEARFELRRQISNRLNSRVWPQEVEDRFAQVCAEVFVPPPEPKPEPSPAPMPKPDPEQDVPEPKPTWKPPGMEM